MSKFRKKLVVIDAIQFVEVSRTQREFGVSVETNSVDVSRFIGKPTRFQTVPNGTKEGEIKAVIETLEGEMMASIGDYIIKGVEGEFYPCKPEIFHMTYEAVDE